MLEKERKPRKNLTSEILVVFSPDLLSAGSKSYRKREGVRP
jgi:hypothetical protein